MYPIPPQTSRPVAAPSPPNAPSPGPAGFSRRWSSTIATVGLLAVLLLGGLWFVKRDRPVGLSVAGAPIANARTVLNQADVVFAELVRADGARPAKGAACWFAPPAGGKEIVSPSRNPRVACGPVLLGVSGADKPWVTGTISYQTSNGEAIGTFGKLTAVETLDRGTLAGRGGQRPPGTGGLEVPVASLRAKDGRRLTGEDDVIRASEQAFGRAAGRTRAAVAEGAGCWFGVMAGITDRSISDGAVWCGPLRLQGSNPGATWTTWSLTSSSTEWFPVSQLEWPSITSISSTVVLEPGVRLYRPDGRVPPDGTGLAPPDAAPKEAGYVDVLDQPGADLQLQAPTGDGRLRIPSRRLQIEAVARVPKIGSGKEAVVAADGEELVVARFTRTDPRGGPSDRGTAQLIVDARRQAFSKWASLPENGVLVVSVPRGASGVLLEVLFDGVAQTISLVTGERGPDARAASYRAAEPVGIGKPFDLSVPLPAGDPAGISGVVTEARIDAWRQGTGWAPPGQAFLTLSLSSVKTRTPCCAVSTLKVTPSWRLILPPGMPVEASAVAGGRSDVIVFVVPDATSTAQVQVSATATFRQGNDEKRSTGGPLAIPLDLPV